VSLIPHEETHERTRSIVAKRLKELMGVTGRKNELRVTDVRVDARLDKEDIEGQLDARLMGRTWGDHILVDDFQMFKSRAHQHHGAV